MLPLDRIYCGNNLDLIEDIDDNSVDLVFYSPPYFDVHRYGESPQEIGHGQDLEQYLASMAQLNRACARVLKPTGNLVINVMDLVRENRPVYLADMLIRDVTNGARCVVNPDHTAKLDHHALILIEKIVWFIVNKMPVASDRRFCNKFEWILHLAKTDEYYFNLDAVREPHGKWGAIDAKKRPEKWNAMGKNPGNDWNFPAPADNDIQAGQRDVPGGDHWDIKAYRVAGKRKFHKAAFPIELCDRVIQAWCPVGGIVLDPFVGSGTACLSARELGRKFVGFELSPANVSICEKRLSGELV